jgi:hypothetical protein
MSLSAIVSSALLMGLAGSGHCTAMCGGLVGLASSATSSPEPRRPRAQFRRIAASSAGRLLSYAMAGGGAGAAGGGLASMVAAERLPWALRLLAGALMISVGLHLAGLTKALRPVEWLGHVVWGRISGTALRFSVVRSTSGAFVFGLLWGWLPCGLVYAALALASATGSAAHGALAMTAFGVGTLPMLVALGWTGAFATRHARSARVRWLAAAAMLLLGLVQVAAAGRSMRSAATPPACHSTTTANITG